MPSFGLFLEDVSHGFINVDDSPFSSRDVEKVSKDESHFQGRHQLAHQSFASVHCSAAFLLLQVVSLHELGRPDLGGPEGVLAVFVGIKILFQRRQKVIVIDDKLHESVVYGLGFLWKLEFNVVLKANFQNDFVNHF